MCEPRSGLQVDGVQSELATHLTGRYIPVNIYTFSFNEFLKANNIEISSLNLSTSEKGKILNYHMKISNFQHLWIDLFTTTQFGIKSVDNYLMKN